MRTGSKGAIGCTFPVSSRRRNGRRRSFHEDRLMESECLVGDSGSLVVGEAAFSGSLFFGGDHGAFEGCQRFVFAASFEGKPDHAEGWHFGVSLPDASALSGGSACVGGGIERRCVAAGSFVDVGEMGK